MDIERARELLVHRFNDEVTDRERRDLEAFIAGNPDFAEEAEKMEAAWLKLDLLKEETRTMPRMGQALSARLNSGVSHGKIVSMRKLRWALAAAALVLIALSALYFATPLKRILGLGAVAPQEKNNVATQPGKPVEPSSTVAVATQVPGKGAVAVEVARTDRTPRLLRSRGLILVKAPDDKRWRLLRRGEDARFGQTVRVVDEQGFGAVLLGADGSTVSLKAGSRIVCRAERQWELLAGAASFGVAKAMDAFSVKTPDGTTTALGTEFALYVTQPDEKRAVAGSTLVEVAAGKVELSPAGKAKPVQIAAGGSGIADADGARVLDRVPGSPDWLLQMQAWGEADDTVARLVAQAGEQGKKLALEISSYSVNVTVVDGVARTFLDMRFMNNTDQRLEGTFYYSLPADASISEFAMYVGDKRIVGEVLEMQRARQIFEYIRREQRDPALLEWVGGNLFKMRVYPIEPKSDKRIQLGYTQVLRRREGQVSYTFPLVSEMLAKNPLHNLSMQVSIASSPGMTNLQCPTHKVNGGIVGEATAGGGGATQIGKSAAVSFSAREYTPERDFHLTWRVPDSAECIVLTNRRTDEPEGYFMAQVDPRIQAAPRPTPERLLVVLDGSASVDPQSFSVAGEFAVGSASMVNGWDFNVALAGHGTKFMWDGFHAADWNSGQSVRDFVAERKPLGGTDLLATFAAVADAIPPGQPVRVVYVGDGVDTLGSLEGAKLVDAIAKLFAGKDVEVSFVAVGSSYDKPVLSALAARLGGTFQAVEGVSDVFEAADRVLDEFSRPVLRDVALSFEGLETAALYPPALGTLAVGDTGLVLGRVVKGGKGIAVVTGTADGKAFKREYAVDMPQPEADNQFLPRLWAKAHMDALRAQMGVGEPERDGYLRDQIIAVSIHYQIMSPYTAFLVLESEEDYKRFGIVRRMRMVDWRGQAAATQPKPKGAPLTSADVIPMLLPEPPFRMAVRENVFPQGVVIDAMTASEVGGGAGYGAYYARVGAGNMPMSSHKTAGPSAMYRWADASEPGELFDYNGRLGEELGRKSAEGGKDLFFDSDAEWLSEGSKISKSELRSDIKELDLADEDWNGDGLATEFYADFLKAAAKPMGGPVAALAPAPSRARTSRPLNRDLYFEGGDEWGQMKDRRYSGNRSGPGYNRGFTGYLDSQGVAEIQTDDGQKLIIKRPGLDELSARRAVAVKADSVQNHLDLALALLRVGKFKGALAELGIVLKSASKSTYLWSERAWLQNQLGDKDGAYESLQKAGALIPAQPKEQSANLRRQYAGNLSAVGHYAEASREYLALGEESNDENAAPNDYVSAYHQAVAAKQPQPAEVLDRMLARWPQGKQAYFRAANALSGADPQRALALAEKAQELGQDTHSMRAQILFSMKKEDEAWKMLEDAFFQAKDANQARDALSNAYNRDRARATKWAERAATDGKRPQLDGAVWFLQNWDVSAKTSDRLLELALKDDFPADLRTQVFNVLHRRGNRNDKWAAVLSPLLKDTETKQARSLAFSALQTLASYGYYPVGRPCLDALLKRTDLDAGERSQLANVRWQFEWNGGDRALAVEHMQAALQSAQDVAYASTFAANLKNVLPEMGQPEKAIAIVAEMYKRFPDNPGNDQLYNGLAQRFQQQGQKDLLAQLTKTAREASGKPSDLFANRFDQAVKIVEDKDFAGADKQLRPLGLDIERSLKEARSGLDDLDAKLKPAQDAVQKAETAKDDGAETAAAKAAARSALQALSRQRQVAAQEVMQLADLLERARWLRVRTAAMKDDLRAAFLAECKERAGAEDPVAREWTNAALACLRFASDRGGYRDMLEKLAQAEPKDPVWPRLLANAYVTTGELAKARPILDRLVKEDPDDISLAVSRHALIEKTGDEKEATAATKELLETLKANPNALQEMARLWQQQKRTDLAVQAYLALQESSSYKTNGWPTVQAANLLHSVGDDKRAVELYLRALETPEWARNGTNAVGELTNLLNAEENLLAVEKRVPALLMSKEPLCCAYGTMLAYHAARARKNQDQAGKQLNALVAMPLNGDSNVAYMVIHLLYDGKRYAQAVEYARNGGGEFSTDQRRNMLENAANVLSNERTARALAVPLFRELIQQGSGNADNYRRSIVTALVGEGKLKEAMDEVSTWETRQNEWSYWDSLSQIIRAYTDRKEFATAARIALDGWIKQGRAQQNYGYQMWSSYTDTCWHALEARQLTDEMKQTLTDEIMGRVKRVMADNSDANLWQGSYEWNLAEKLGLEAELLKLADEAAKSEDPLRLIRAGEIYRMVATDRQYRREVMEKAIQTWRNALALATMPAERRSSVYSQLYDALTGYGLDRWKDAFDLLEPWKAAGLDQWSYLDRSIRCLYKLNRVEEARADVHGWLKLLPARRDPWQAENLAGWCHEAKDYTTEVELREYAVRMWRSQRQPDWGNAVRLYQALTQAYSAQGENEKAIEAALRGLSLIDRHQQRNYYLELSRTLMEVTSKGINGGLDAVVARYEKTMAPNGEMPHMRIAFGEAYRQAKQEEKALAQLSIAADLLPKDTVLRKEVIDGYVNLGKREEAEKAYLSWAKLDPQNVEVFKGLGELYDRMGRGDDAMAAYATMAEARPREAEGHRAYAQVLVTKKLPGEAVIEYVKAVQFRPTEFAIVNEMADVYKAVGRTGDVPALYKQGETACRRAMDDLPDDPLPWLNLARFLKAEGRTEDARQVCLQAIARPWPRFANDTQRDARAILETLR